MNGGAQGKVHTRSTRYFAWCRLSGVVFLLFAVTAALSQSHQAPRKTAGAGFKNVQVLKGVSPEQLDLSMQFMSDSLGVSCNFCHVDGAFQKDDKKLKQTARRMMQMMFAINRENFDGAGKVTCYSCHRGSRHPLTLPNAGGPEPEAPAKEATVRRATDSLPPTEQIIEHYVQAAGGGATLGGISSRLEEGKAEIEGREFPLKIYYESPGKLTSILHLPNGDDLSVYDGHTGWIAFPGQRVLPMEGHQLDAVRLDAELRQPAQVNQLGGLQVRGIAKVDEKDSYIVASVENGRPATELYFDQQSGLLLRVVRFIENPLGRNSVQTDFSDYRQSGALKIPFRWTVARPGARYVIQLDRVSLNVPLERGLFEKPMAEATSH